MRKILLMTAFMIVACAVAVVTSFTIADAPDSKSADQVELKLPAGWTEDDMKACMLAGTPGEMHEQLARSVGEWQGNTTMWMVPGADPMTSECSVTVTPFIDGRFTKCEWAGEMPGMGPYKGFGIYGFDNVSQKLISIWLDNHSTGIMRGEGKQSSDGKSITWKFSFNCPITKKLAVMREVETITGPNTKTLEMFGSDPKSGKEFKMMSVELTRKTGSDQAGS